jgi:hypothetical protein
MVIPFQRSEGCSKSPKGFHPKCSTAVESHRTALRARSLNGSTLVLNLSQPSKAAIRGMSYQDLLRGPDFTRAVNTIAEQCSVNVDIAKLKCQGG